MNNGANYDFDELEPRITPQPTALKCMTPSVPEVSLIFGKRPESPQPPKPQQNQQQGKYESYASWKKEEFPPASDPKTDSRYALQLLNKSCGKKSPAPPKSPQNNSPNFRPAQKFPEALQKSQRQSEGTKSLGFHNSNTETPTRVVESVRFQNYDRNSPETCSFPFPPAKLVDSPAQKRHEGVKSILKSSQFERTEYTNSPGSPDSRFQRKCPTSASQSPRNRPPESHFHQTVPPFNRQIEENHDRGTVQDLLLLVKNQNEQIKALQNQVEKLLKAHEETLVNREIRNCSSRRQNDCPQSPNYDQEHRNAPTNSIPGQKSCHGRGMKIVPPFPGDEAPEMCLRYQSDQMRGAIMEKKVSIGVMTSFEFSVHNNPFVSDSEHQINAVLRECGKGIDASENWRRNIGPGPLENINEDSESYPSSLWKQSNSNTQMSANSKRTSLANDNKNYSQNGNRCSPISGDIGGQSGANDSENAFKRTPQAPVPAPRKISTCNRDQRLISTGSEQRIRKAEVFGNSGPEKMTQRESNNGHYVRDKNDYNREKGEVFGAPCSPNNERFPRNLGCFNPDFKSMENTDETSLVINSSELRVNDRPPSPDPSIHVEMREYSSDDENEKSKRAPPVGWTFYKNIVGQVNRILHTIPDTKDAQENGRGDGPMEAQNENDGPNEEAVDSVKLATLERLKMLGISYAEHSEYTGEHVQKKVTFDSSYCPRLDYQTTLPQSTNTVTESNTSMHMKALALKYLSDEQLADLAVQKQGDSNAMKQKILNSVHGTNMSLATMNYLQRYCLVSGVNSPHADGKGHVNAIRQKKLKHVVMTKELHAQQMPRNQAFNESASSQKGPDNILDITTLKQQPKLL